jgi:4-hydroxy-tetrahydrodipicolinate synthase
LVPRVEEVAQTRAGFYIAGGWAVTQMIEALDRGIDAIIPESSMARVYTAIDRHFSAAGAHA